MLRFNLPVTTTTLRILPQVWGEDPSPRWLEWCNQLQHQLPTNACLSVPPERKWELVSAYQKCVRRGLLDEATWLLGGMLSLGRWESRYFWRRICTTAAEDIGYGDPELVNFVVACSMIYGSIGYPEAQRHAIWTVLTRLLCEAPKCRIYGQLSVLLAGVHEQVLDLHTLPPSQQTLIARWQQAPPVTAKTRWCKQNNWRAEGMLNYQHLTFPDAEYDPTPLPAHTMLGGFPDFAYDMHTRLGKQLMTQLSKVDTLQEIFTAHPTKAPSHAVGWAIFLREGGRVNNGVHDATLDLLSDHFVAAKFQWPIEVWQAFAHRVQGLLAQGVVTEYRQVLVAQAGY